MRVVIAATLPSGGAFVSLGPTKLPASVLPLSPNMSTMDSVGLDLLDPLSTKSGEDQVLVFNERKNYAG